MALRLCLLTPAVFDMLASVKSVKFALSKRCDTSVFTHMTYKFCIIKPTIIPVTLEFQFDSCPSSISRETSLIYFTR